MPGLARVLIVSITHPVVKQRVHFGQFYSPPPPPGYYFEYAKTVLLHVNGGGDTAKIFPRVMGQPICLQNHV
jgi:hypothetical protein